MSSDFAVTVVNRNGRVIIFMGGEIDMAARKRVHEALLAAQHASADVVIDLSRVTFMDSTGINALVGARREIPVGRLHIVGVPGRVRRAFDVCGVTQYLLEMDGDTPLYGSLHEVLRATEDSPAPAEPLQSRNRTA